MIYERKFPLKQAKVFLHYDQKNQRIHLDLRIPKHSLRLNIPERCHCVRQDGRSKTMHDIKVILKVEK